MLTMSLRYGEIPDELLKPRHGACRGSYAIVARRAPDQPEFTLGGRFTARQAWGIHDALKAAGFVEVRLQKGGQKS